MLVGYGRFAEAECTSRRKATISTKDRNQKDFCFAEACSESRCEGDISSACVIPCLSGHLQSFVHYSAYLPTSVHKALSVDDQEALKDEGITLPEVAHRRRRIRKRKHHASTAEDDASHHTGPTADVGCTPVASSK